MRNFAPCVCVSMQHPPTEGVPPLCHSLSHSRVKHLLVTTWLIWWVFPIHSFVLGLWIDEGPFFWFSCLKGDIQEGDKRKTRHKKSWGINRLASVGIGWKGKESLYPLKFNKLINLRFNLYISIKTSILYVHCNQMQTGQKQFRKSKKQISHIILQYHCFNVTLF